MGEGKPIKSYFSLGASAFEQHTLRKSITVSYLLALTLIAVLAVGGYVALSSAIETQERGVAITKDISRHLTLSQRISLLALQLAVESDSEKRVEIKSVLNESILEMQSSHDSLTAQRSEWKLLTKYSNHQGGAYLNPPIDLDQRVETFLSSAMRLVLTPDVGISLKNSDVQFLLSVGSESLRESIDYAIKRYEGITAERIEFLKDLEVGSLVSILIVLCLEGWFVFRPMVRRIHESTKVLQDSALEIAAVIETVGEGIISCDDRGIIRGLNRAVKRLWKTSKREILGKPISSLFETGQTEVGHSESIIP
ncbi:MAG: hypothetical protein KDD53_11295, partial [Bdellovibrionales bacterium]|nr:hypothetical protein [Bdellovibrionales bacterium]